MAETTDGHLASALVAAQRAMKPALKDSTNPHYGSRYADLASVWEACRGPLTEAGIAVVQVPSAEGNRVTITTILLHASGERLEGALTMTAKDPSPQAIGSAITYARRYALAAMVGIAPDDDDGNAAQPAMGTPADFSSEVTNTTTGEIDGLQVVSVDSKPTRKPGVTRYTITLSDGRKVATIKDLLASLASRYAESGAAVRVTTKTTDYGIDLVSIDAHVEVTADDIPF